MPTKEQENALLAYIKSYEKLTKSGIGIIPLDDMNKFDEFYNMPDYKGIKNSDLREYMTQVKKNFTNPKFSEIDSLSEGMLAVICSKYYYKLKADGKDLFDEKKALDPYYRRMLELVSVSPHISQAEQRKAQEISEQMNEIVLQNTLSVTTDDEYNRILETQKGATKIVNEMLDRSRLEQCTIAKTLFMSHLGNMFVMQNDGRNAEFKGSVADSMAHGGRTLFLLPKGENTACNNFKQYYFHNKIQTVDNGTAVTGRFAASHSVKTGDSAESADSFKEKSKTAFSGNYQMNPAIGGLGKTFGDKPILNDGRNGQVFMQLQPGTDKKGGYLMVGFENEASMTTGRTGHFHSPTASEAKFSCFMASKGGPGASKNGRVVDLSMYKPDQINKLLEEFNYRYQNLQLKAANTTLLRDKGVFSKAEQELAKKQLSEINKNLCGKVMDKAAFLDMAKTLGMSKEHLDIIANADPQKSKENFAKLNQKSEAKLEARREELGVQKIAKRQEDEKSYQVSPGIQKLLNDLNKAKGKKYDWTKESDKMARIKMQLTDLVDVCQKGELGENAAKEAFSNLFTSCVQYAFDASKNADNNRMKAVKAVLKYSSTELDNLGLTANEKNALLDKALKNDAAISKQMADNKNVPKAKVEGVITRL